MYVERATEPERRNVGGWKSSNHAVTSEGGEDVKRRPTWPLRFCLRKYSWLHLNKGMSACDVLVRSCVDPVGALSLVMCQGLLP